MPAIKKSQRSARSARKARGTKYPGTKSHRSGSTKSHESKSTRSGSRKAQKKHKYELIFTSIDGKKDGDYTSETAKHANTAAIKAYTRLNMAGTVYVWVDGQVYRVRKNSKGLPVATRWDHVKKTRHGHSKRGSSKSRSTR